MKSNILGKQTQYCNVFNNNSYNYIIKMVESNTFLRQYFITNQNKLLRLAYEYFQKFFFHTI